MQATVSVNASYTGRNQGNLNNSGPTPEGH